MWEPNSCLLHWNKRQKDFWLFSRPGRQSNSNLKKWNEKKQMWHEIRPNQTRFDSSLLVLLLLHLNLSTARHWFLSLINFSTFDSKWNVFATFIFPHLLLSLVCGDQLRWGAIYAQTRHGVLGNSPLSPEKNPKRCIFIFWLSFQLYCLDETVRW